MKQDFACFEKINHHCNRSCSQQLREFMIAAQEKMFVRGEKERGNISTIEELEAYNTRMRGLFLEGLGGLPQAEGPLNAQVTKRTDIGECILEQVIFNSRPGVYVTGTMYLPKGITDPRPAILFLCGHFPEARMAPQYQMVCRTLVRAGFVVFAMDPTGQGERSNFYDAVSQQYCIHREVPDHDACGVPAVATGRFLASYMLSDQLRAIDYMRSHPQIDGDRIGITGNSGGATQALLSMICDERIAAAAPGTYISNRREILSTEKAQDSEQIWPGISKHGFDHVNAIMLMTPKPVALLAVTYDFFPIEGTRASYAEAGRFYEMYGKADQLQLFEDCDTHNYTKKLAVQATEFLSAALFGEKRTVENEDIEALPEALFYATASGNINSEMEDAKTTLEEVREYAQCQRRNRMALSPEQRKAKAKKWLLEKVLQERVPTDFNLRMHDSLSRVQWEYTDGYAAIGVSWWTQKRLFAYATLIKKAGKEQDKELPAVIAVWTDGTKKIREHEEWIRKQCDSGKQVFVLDVPGVGNLEQVSMFPSMDCKVRYGTMYRLCCDLMFLDDSMAAMHCYDVLRAVEMVHEHFHVPEEEITLYCDEEEGVYGVMAGFLNSAVKMEYGQRLLRSVEKEILGETFPVYRNTLCLLVPGMLEYFDYEELLR